MRPDDNYYNSIDMAEELGALDDDDRAALADLYGDIDAAADFDESEHPRDAQGRFTDAGGPAPAPLKFGEAKQLAQELETGRTRLAGLLTKRPDVTAWSQAVLRAHVGDADTVPVFRAVTLLDNGDMRDEAVVSTSLDPLVAFRIAQDAPGFLDRASRTVVVRYDIPLDRVRAYCPALIAHARASLSADALSRTIATRRSARMSLRDVFDETRGEQEVLADVSGLRPAAVWDRGTSTVSERTYLAIAMDRMRGDARASSASRVVADQRDSGWIFDDVAAETRAVARLLDDADAFVRGAKPDRARALRAQEDG